MVDSDDNEIFRSGKQGGAQKSRAYLVRASPRVTESEGYVKQRLKENSNGAIFVSNKEKRILNGYD